MRKALNFDLDTNALKEYYPKEFHQAYYDVRKFMESRGFEHRQGSGYISVGQMTDREVVKTIQLLKIKMPWITKCVKKFDVTNVGREYDLTNYFKDNTSDMEQNEPISEKLLKSVGDKIKALDNGFSNRLNLTIK